MANGNRIMYVIAEGKTQLITKLKLALLQKCLGKQQSPNKL